MAGPQVCAIESCFPKRRPSLLEGTVALLILAGAAFGYRWFVVGAAEAAHLVTQNGFDTPEAAAMSTFPAESCSVVAARTEGDDAYVLLDTGPPERPYLYGVNCHRTDGRWFEGASSNGPGWGQTDDGTDVGTLSLWNDVPMGVDSVRVAFGGAVIDEPVQNGAYLLVWFRVQLPSEWPRVVAVRRSGNWEAESCQGLALRVAAERGYGFGGTA